MKRSMAEKAVKIFLDSNVILSGFLSDRGAPRVILDILALKLPSLQGATGRYNIIEIERNLKKKVPAAFQVYKDYFLRINLTVIPLPAAEEVKESPWIGKISLKDVPVLISAEKWKADYLITGDKKDFGGLRATTSLSFKILEPAEFIRSVIPEYLRQFEI